MLDSLFYNDAIETKKIATIIGYADYVGEKGYNEALSQNRARYVYDYLLTMGFSATNIRQYIGKGEVARIMESNEGFATDRRVDIVLERKANSIKKVTLPAVAKPDKPASGIDITNIEPGKTLVLKKIFFYAGRHVVREESLPEMDNLYYVLSANPTLKIQIEGHVCCVKSGVDALDEDTFEHALSENRAKYIYQYLVRRGINSNRLKYMGFGRTRPIIENEKTEEDGDINRRVEIRVLEK